MRTSTFKILQRPALIILSAGHGGGAPGACNGPHREADQVITMVDVMGDVLRSLGVASVKVPHTLGLADGIRWINEHYAFGSAWALEVHRDSATGLTTEDANFRCGIYHGTTAESKDIGAAWVAAARRFGAGSRSWSRPHTDSPHKRLAWISQPRPLSHLLELGFMQGDNSDAHLRGLATLAARAVAEVFTGKSPPLG